MPEFTGATDEKHTFTLPSEIDRVYWDRRQAAPGGIVGLTVQTLFCGDGSQIQIKLQDAQGTVHNTLSGKLRGDSINVDLQVPPNATGGLLAKVEMPNHGLSAESEALKVVEPVRMRGARWSQETVKRGDIVTLSAEARRAQDGRRARVRIFERDPGRGAHDPVTHLRPRTEGGAVEVKYQFQYPGETTGIVPEWEAPDGYTQPEFFYTVEVAGVTADSKTSKSKGVMTFVDDVTLRLLDAGSHAPLPDQKAKITLADGSTRQKSLDGEGRVQLQDVPPGPLKLQLPEYTPPTDSDGSGSKRSGGGVPDGAISFPVKSKESRAMLSTGGEETVYVVPPRIDTYLEHGFIGAGLSKTDYELKVKTKDGSTATFDGTIGKNGRLRQALPLGAVGGVLRLRTETGDRVVPLDLSALPDEEGTTGMQSRLAQAGSYAGRADGDVASVTRKGILALQRRRGTDPTGAIPEGDRPMLDGLRFRKA